MLRITGPDDIDKVEIILANLDKNNVSAIAFHMQMENYRCNATFVDTASGLFIRGYFVRAHSTSTFNNICQLLTELSKIFKVPLSGTFAINNKVWSFEHEGV